MTDQAFASFECDTSGVAAWLEQLGQAPQFERICDVVGVRLFAFAWLAGMRVTDLEVDAAQRENSLVRFDTEAADDATEDVAQTLPLHAFREQAMQRLCSHPDSPLGWRGPPDAEELTAFVGEPFVCLAVLFDVELLELRRYATGRHTVLIHLGEGATRELSVEELREALREAVRSEALAHAPPAVEPLDLDCVPEAERALREGDLDRVLALLGGWPEPLSRALRASEGQTLGERERRGIARAMEVLGRAYVQKGQIDWADGVVRLGIQWVQESEAAAGLFQCLGLAYVGVGRHGEAIGLLRRAGSLGAPDREVLPALAQAYAARGRYVAAMVCWHDAQAAGATGGEEDALGVELQRQLGEPYRRWRDWLGAGAD